jgi:hypothetical protein
MGLAQCCRGRLAAATGDGGIVVEQPHMALMRKADELLRAGDFAGFLAVHTENAVMHVPGIGPVSGDYRGRNGIAGAIRKEISFPDEQPQCECHNTLAATRTPSSS